MVTIGQTIHLPAGVTRRAFAVFLLLHGVAHLVGTADSFKGAADGRTVDYLGGSWAVSDPTALRALGIAWALIAAAYLVVTWAYWTRAPWRLGALLAATVPSLILSVTAVWKSWVGVAIDVLLLGIVVWLRTRTHETAPRGAGAMSPRG